MFLSRTFIIIVVLSLSNSPEYEESRSNKDEGSIIPHIIIVKLFKSFMMRLDISDFVNYLQFFHHIRDNKFSCFETRVA